MLPDNATWCDGDWHHFACICNRDNAVHILQVFKDGVLIGQENGVISGSILAVDTIDCSSGDVFIGKHGESTSLFSGSLDEIRIYNRALDESGILNTALDSTGLTTAATGEVLKNYKHGKSKHS